MHPMFPVSFEVHTVYRRDPPLLWSSEPSADSIPQARCWACCDGFHFDPWVPLRPWVLYPRYVSVTKGIHRSRSLNDKMPLGFVDSRPCNAELWLHGGSPMIMVECPCTA